MSSYNPWEDPYLEFPPEPEDTQELDLSEKLVYILDNDKLYLKLVFNAQLKEDGTIEMDDGTVKKWLPYKHV